ncbi:MAG: CapA family protein [Bacilli bacterium]|nr:CapA family protein [Bacilli bacterium]
MAKRKVRKVKKKIKVFLVLSILLIATGIFLETSGFSKNTKKEPKKVVSKTKAKDYEIKLFMVGDALIHSAVYTDAKGSDGSYDFKPMLDRIKPISSKYDLAYYNQETVLGGTELGLSNYPRFNSPYEVGDAFIDAGFDLVSLATNHTMDKNEEGVLNSVKYWKKHKKVVTSGQWDSKEERDKVRIYKKNGIKYAFISYTTWTNGLETPEGKEYLNNVYSDEKAKEDIEKVRDKVDVVIVAMHWGTEYSLGVSEEQTKIANHLSDLGVDLIIGAHPHVVEPVEYINDNKTFVIYSLGNFISDQEGTERLTGLMMEVTIKKHVDKKKKTKVTIEDPKGELIYTKSNVGGKRNFKVYPYSELNNNILTNYMSFYSKYKTVVSERCPDLTWGLTEE